MVECQDMLTINRTFSSALEELSQLIARNLQENAVMEQEFHDTKERRKQLRLKTGNLSKHLEAIMENVQGQIMTISSTPRLLKNCKCLLDEMHSLDLEQKSVHESIIVLNKTRLELQNRITVDRQKYQDHLTQFKGVEHSQIREIENLSREIENLQSRIITAKKQLRKDVETLRNHYEKQMASIGKSTPSDSLGAETSSVRRKLLFKTKENQKIQEEISGLEKQLETLKAGKAGSDLLVERSISANSSRKTRRLFTSKKNRI